MNGSLGCPLGGASSVDSLQRNRRAVAARSLKFALLAATAIAGLSPSLAHAVTIDGVTTVPGATYSISVKGGPDDGSPLTTKSTTAATPSSLEETGFVNTGPNGVVTWDATVTNNYAVPSVRATASSAGGIARADTELDYYIEVYSPTPNTTFQMASVNVKASGGITNGGEAQFQVIGDSPLHNGNPNHNGSPLDFTPGFGGSTQPFSIDQAYGFLVNEVYRVTLSASAVSSAGKTSTAYIDPVFTPEAGYRLIMSAGIGPSTVAATPIPATLPLFASGVGGLGLLGWRRKRQAAALRAG
jgi:hypothetical protein